MENVSIGTVSSSHVNLDASIEALIAQAKEEAIEEAINCLHLLEHLVEPEIVAYVAKILRGGCRAVN